MDDTLKLSILGDSEGLIKTEHICKSPTLVAQYASAFCTLDSIKHLESVGCDFSFNEDEDNNGTAAIAAEYNKDYKVAQYLYDKYGKEAAVSELDYTLGLYGLAVVAGNFDVAGNIAKEYKNIWEACTTSGSKDSVEYLIKNGYEPTDKEIRSAFQYGNKNCLEYMIHSDGFMEALKSATASEQDQAMCNAVNKNADWGMALFKAGIRPGSESMREILGGRNIELGKQIADKYEDSDVLYDEYVAAINCGCMDIIKYITNKGIDINKTVCNKEIEPSEFNLIHIAATCPSTTVLQYLIDHGADVNAIDSDGNNAIIWAQNAGMIFNEKILSD